jgi:hypothetical protein
MYFNVFRFQLIKGRTRISQNEQKQMTCFKTIVHPKKNFHLYFTIYINIYTYFVLFIEIYIYT